MECFDGLVIRDDISFRGFMVVPDVSLTLGLLPDIVIFLAISNCSFIESQVLETCLGHQGHSIHAGSSCQMQA